MPNKTAVGNVINGFIECLVAFIVDEEINEIKAEFDYEWYSRACDYHYQIDC